MTTPHKTLTLALGAAVTGAAVLAAAPAGAAGSEIHVSTRGSDGNAGTATSPLRTVQAAADRAKPGTTIRVHGGTYVGEIRIKNSGTASAPITVTPAGDGAVTLTSNQSPDSCYSSAPSPRRTIKMLSGADYWTFKGLNIHHGAYLSGKGSGKVFSWHAALVKKKIWQPRRAVPGAGSYNPTAARNAIPYLAKALNTALDPVVGVKFIDNTITGRGIFATLTTSGVVQGNRISKIICGSGPGVWIMNHSNFWTVTGNDVTDIAISRAAHYMQEGIRFGSAANYNKITNNKVHDLQGDGRAFNTDVDSSYNTFEKNFATNVAIGYNDQMAGWNNRWRNNTVTNYRQYGYGYRLMDASLSLPSMSTSTNGVVSSGNVALHPARSGAKAMGAGGMMKGTFSGNNFNTFWMSKNLTRDWSSYGNTWNGSSAVPK